MAVGIHIHNCIAKQKQKQAQRIMNANHLHQTCDWDTCQKATKVWTSRETYVEHLLVHIDYMQAKGRLGKKSYCNWKLEDGDLCEAWGSDDWQAHFAIAHSINTQEKVAVEYCVICCEW